MRSSIMAPGASTEAFARSDIHACFHHSPDEKAGQQDTQQHRLVSEKRLHALRPFRLCRFPRAQHRTGVIQREEHLFAGLADHGERALFPALSGPPPEASPPHLTDDHP